MLLVDQLARLGKPQPDLRNVPYGPHERNVLDLWSANTKGPAPLLVFIHGGAFLSGSKNHIPALLLKSCLDSGISVAAINYRLSQHAPYPAPMLDSARAIQFIRQHAAEWHIDPTRIAASGSSAGGGIALWLAFHDDLADPNARDPVMRESTRLACAGVVGAQTSYDPRFIKSLIGGRADEHPALPPFFGLASGEHASERIQQVYEDASPINHVTQDDPPAFLYYQEPKGPLPSDAAPGQGIHHPRFGDALNAKLNRLGIECVVRHQDDYAEQARATPEMYRDLLRFIAKHQRISQ
jgi:acetyl esterase/lipase